MKKKQVKHFVPKPFTKFGGGFAACGSILALFTHGEVAKTRRGVTCKNCRGTRIFRKLK